MATSALRTVLDGIYFGESPRWRDGALWFVDMHGHEVRRWTPDGGSVVVTRFDDDEPSGLGWLPDGRLLIVAMETGQLRRLEPDGSVVVHADLSPWARGSINDMIVRSDGTAYVGDMGRRVFGDPAPRSDPAGRARR